MNKNAKKVLIITTALTLSLSLILTMKNNNTAYSEYSDSITGDDTFYIIDENGDAITITPSQSELEKLKEEENNNYEVVCVSEYDTEVIGEYDDVEEAQDMYEQAVNMTMMRRTVSSQEIQVVNNDNVVATNADVKGIVRFKRTVATNSSGNSYVKNITYKEVITGRTGYINPSAISDAAYIRTESDGIVCKMSGVVIKVDLDDVQAIESFDDSLKLSYYYISDGYLIHYFTYYDGSSVAMGSTRVGYKPSYLSSGVKYYSYDGHYFYKSFDTMITDYQNDTYTNSINSTNPYYNYYQYLSLRSKAIFTGTQYNNYITSKKENSVMADLGDDFVNAQNTYTINSMLMFGVAINESGWGTSNIAISKNNLFGLNAADSNTGNANTYYSLTSCINDWAYGWMSCQYLDGTDYRYRGPHFGDKQSGINVKYASDPYWGEKGSSRSYYFDTSKSDYGRYTIGIASSPIINLYKEANTNKVIYTSEAGEDGNLYDYPLIILDTVTTNGVKYYKVQSDMALKDDRSGRDVTATYKPSRDYVYVKASDVDIVFEGSGEISVPSMTFDDVLENLSLTNSSIYLTGFTLGTNISTITSKIKKLDSSITVTFKNSSSTTITSATIATGMTMTIGIGSNSKTYTVVIRGDVNGDGKVNAKDLLKMEKYIISPKINTLTDLEFYASDINQDSKVNATDLLKVELYIVKGNTLN